MVKKQDALLREAREFISDEELIKKIGENFKASLDEVGLTFPEGMVITFDESGEKVIMNSDSQEVNPVYTALVKKCADEVFWEVIEFYYTNASSAIRNKSSKFLIWGFYLINLLLIIGVTSWVFAVLNSSDFRAWYYSEFVATGTALVTYAFLILFPLIFIASAVGLYLSLKRGYPEASLSRMVLKFELPAVLVTLVAKMLIVDASMTSNLRLFLLFLFIAIIINWFIIVIKAPVKSTLMAAVYHWLTTISLVTTIYFILAVAVPMAVVLLIELDLIDLLSDVFESIIFEPLLIVYMLFWLVIFLIPLVLLYFFLRNLIIHFKESYSTLSGEAGRKFSLMTSAAIPVLFFVMLFITSRYAAMGEYGEMLVLLAQSNDSYTTLETRALPLLNDRAEVDKRMDHEFNRYENYIFRSSNFDGTPFGGYMQVFLFPFIDYSDRSGEDNSAAYEKGYERAFGETYSSRNFSSESIKQVQHLSRDILVDTKKSSYLAEVTITDSFSTFVSRDQEVVFEFSLPEEAVVTELLLGSALQYRGQIAPRGAAEQVYTEQVQQRIDPALLEQVGPRQYRLRVYPVPASNESAARIRNEEVEGDIQRVQFTYLVLRDTDGIPLPDYSEKFNILSTETKYNVQLDGKPATLDTSMRHVVDAKSINELCEINDNVSVNLTSNQIVKLSVGGSDCVLEENLLSSITGKQIQIFVDTSYKNKGGETSTLLDQVRGLSPELYKNNEIFLLLYSESVDEAIKLTGPEDVPSIEDIVFFGKSNIQTTFQAINPKSDYVVFLNEKFTDSDKVSIVGNYYQRNENIGMIYTPGHIPSYNLTVTKHLELTASLVIETDLIKALKSLYHRQTDKEFLFAGEYWKLGITELYPLVGTSTASSTEDLLTGLHKDVKKIATRLDIIGLKKGSTPLIKVEELHNRAVEEEIVTPISSNIALVNQAQQNRLNKLSGDGDKYTSEARFQVTQPRMNNAAGGFEGGGVTLMSVGSGSMGLSDARYASPSMDISIPTGVPVTHDERTPAPVILLMILIAGGVLGLIIFAVRKFTRRNRDS